MSNRVGVGEPGGATVALGWALCAAGLLCTLWNAFDISVAYEAMGILLGAAGFFLGARRPGIATVVNSALVFVLAAAQGYMAGIEPSDPRSRFM